MNRSIIRFVSFALVPAVLLSDPSWALGAREAFSNASGGSLHTFDSRQNAVLSQAIVARLAASYRPARDPQELPTASIRISEAGHDVQESRRERDWTRRKFAAAAALLGISLAPLAALAKDKKHKTPVPQEEQRLQIPQAAQIEHENILLTDPQLAQSWVFKADVMDARYIGNLPRLALNNPEVAAKFILQRASWQDLIAMLHYEGKYWSLHPDQLHAVGPALAGDYSTISQALFYPGVSVTEPKSRILMTDIGPIRRDDPGFLHWRTIGAAAGKFAKAAISGIQIASKNQEEASFLKEHGHAFEVRKAYAELEQTYANAYVQAMEAWLEHAKGASQLAEQRDSAWTTQWQFDREGPIGAFEGRDTVDYNRLKMAAVNSRNAYTSSQNQLAPHVIELLGAIAAKDSLGDSDFTRGLTQRLRPEAPAWRVDLDLLGRSDDIDAILAKENAEVIAQPAIALPKQSELDAELAELTEIPSVPERFLADGYRPAEPMSANLESLNELESVLAVIDTETPLGESPLQRRLKLQKDLINISILEYGLKEEATWRIGYHFDIGTQPFLASLLDFNLSIPEANTKLSYKEFSKAVELKMKAIDDEIEAEDHRLRTAFLKARSAREKALADMVGSRNKYATAYQIFVNERAAQNTSASSNAAQAYLDMQQAKHAYAHHLTEAWAAWKLTQLYTVEGQKKIAGTVQDHYLDVINKIDPSHPAKPQDINPPAAEMSAPPALNRRQVLTGGWRSARLLGLAVLGVLFPFVSALVSSAQRAGSGFQPLAPAQALTTGLISGSHVLQSLSTTSPDFIGVIICAIALVILTIWSQIYEPTQTPSRRNYPEFSVNGSAAKLLHPERRPFLRRVWPVLVLAAIGFVEWRFPTAFHDGIHLLALGGLKLLGLFPIINAPWALPIALILVGAAALSRRSASQRAAIQLSVIPALAILTGILLPGFHWKGKLVGMVIAGLWMKVLSFAVRKRWVALIANPLMGIILISSLYHNRIADKIGEYTRQRYKTITNSDMLANNFGVGFQVMRLPELWIPDLNGVVVRSEVNRTTLNPKELAISVTPLSPETLKLLADLNSDSYKLLRPDGDRIFKTPIVSPQHLMTAGESNPNPLIEVMPNPDDSIDKDISDRAVELSKKLETLGPQLDRAAKYAGETGQYDLPGDAQELIIDIKALGHDINGKLIRRAEINVPISKTTHIVQGTVVPEKTVIEKGHAIPLFQQEPPDVNFIHLQMNPSDQLALIQQWHRNPTGSTLKLTSANGPLTIPLSHIIKVLPLKDPTFGKNLPRENLYGNLTIDEAVGVIKTHFVDLVIAFPKRDIATEYTDLSQRYVVKGIFEGSNQIQPAPNTSAIGVFTIENVSPIVSPPQRASRATLQELIASADETIQSYTQLITQVKTMMIKYPESPNWGTMLAKYSGKLKQAKADLNNWTAELQMIERSGVAVKAGEEGYAPADVVLQSINTLNPENAAASLAQGVIQLNKRILAHVHFVANGPLQVGTVVPVRVGNTDRYVDLHVMGTTSRGQTVEDTGYDAEVWMDRATVRQFAPAGTVLDESFATYVEIRLKQRDTPDVKGDPNWYQETIHLDPPAASKPPVRSGPSHLKGFELLLGLFYSAALPITSYIFSFGSDAKMWIASLLGFLVGIGIHEYLGHGIAAWGQGARLRRVGWNLEWQKRNEAGEWQALLDHSVQEAGPKASRMALWLGVIALSVQSIVAFAGHLSLFPIMLTLAATVSSFIFSKADRYPLNLDTSASTPEVVAPSDEGLIAPTLDAEGVVHTPGDAAMTPMEASELPSFLKSLTETVLEEERFWYRGQSMKNLTFKQRLWDAVILHKDKIELTIPKVVARDNRRDNVSYAQAKMQYYHYMLKREESKRGTKPQIYRWVVVLFVLTAIYVIWAAPPEFFSSFRNFVIQSPLGTFLIGLPTASLTVLIILVVLLPLVGGLYKWWGELLSTLSWIFGTIKAGTWDKLFAVEARFESNTTEEDSDEYLDSVVGKKILMRRNPAHDQFLWNLNRFAMMMTLRAQPSFLQGRWSDRRVFENPTQEALAFTTAFRIQVLEHHDPVSAIYKGYRAVLADETQLWQRLERRGYRRNTMDSAQQYRMLQSARVEEAVKLSTVFPLDALMALLRSGSAEFAVLPKSAYLATIAPGAGESPILEDQPAVRGLSEDQFYGSIKDILRQMGKRVRAWDEGAFDDIRAQERSTVFFDTLHFVWAGLRGAPESSADVRQNLRKKLLDWMQWNRDSKNRITSANVTDAEQEIWRAFQERLPTLASGGESQDNIGQGIAYVVTSRKYRNNEKEAESQVQKLRTIIPAGSSTLDDRYLRGDNGFPTTSVLQLKTLYMKYYFLLTLFEAGFPGIRILGKHNIYLMMEYNINLRQTLREIKFLLGLIDGDVYLVNAGGIHDDSVRRLNKIIPERFTYEELSRIKIVRLEKFEDQIRNDRRGITLSSASPNEWLFVKDTLGVAVYSPSPLEKPALVAGLLEIMNPTDLERLFNATRGHLLQRLHQLRNKLDRVKNAQVWSGIHRQGLDIAESLTAGAMSRYDAKQLYRQKRALAWKARGWSFFAARLTHIDWFNTVTFWNRSPRANQLRQEKLENEIETATTELRTVDMLRFELEHVADALKENGVRLMVTSDLNAIPGKSPFPGLDVKEVFDGNYVLDTAVIKVPAEIAHETSDHAHMSELRHAA